MTQCWADSANTICYILFNDLFIVIVKETILRRQSVFNYSWGGQPDGCQEEGRWETRGQLMGWNPLAVSSSIILIADICRTLHVWKFLPPATLQSVIPAGSSKRETQLGGHLRWGVGGVHSAQSFELKLYSFAHSSDRAADWLLPLGPHGTAVAPRLGVARTGLSKTSVFPKAGLGQFSWSSNTVFSEQRRNRLIRIFPWGLVPLMFSMMASQNKAQFWYSALL